MANKFRQNRKEKAGAERAAAHELEGKKQAPKEKTGEKPVESAAPADSMAAPDTMGAGPAMNDDQSSPHGPAHAIHITHDAVSGTHHVHAMYPDGHEDHTDHATAEEAHQHASMAGGCAGEADATGEYPQKHKSTDVGDGDDYTVPELD